MIKFGVALLLVAAVSSSETSVASDIASSVESRPLAGAFTPSGEPSAEAKALIEGLQSAIEEKAGQTYTKFEIVAVSTQIVAGTNYNATIDTD